MIVFQIITFIFIIELLIQVFIRFYKSKFKWFITNDDEIPKFNEKKFKNFLLESFDLKLGWKQKLNTSGLLKEITNTKTYLDHRNLVNKKKAISCIFW